MSRDIEKYACDYLKDDFERVMSRYRKELVCSLLKKYHARNILDVGPSYNYCFEDYADFQSYTIVEPSRIICEQIHVTENVHVHNDYLENCCGKLKDKGYDFIIFSGLLHEIENEDQILQSIYSVSDANTIIHVSVPNSMSFHLRFAFEAGLIDKLGMITPYSKQMQRCRTYNRDSLRNALLKKHFEIVEEGNFFLKLFNQEKMKDCMKSGILDEKLISALAKMGDLIPDAAAEIYCNVRIKENS